MSMKNFVIPNLDWNKHPSRHRSSGDRDRVSSKSRLQSNPESSQVKAPACHGLMASSLRPHTSVRSGFTDSNDGIGVPSLSPSSSKCNKPLIEYSRQPRDSDSRFGKLRNDQICGVETADVRKNGLGLGQKRSRSVDNSALEISAKRKKTGVLVKEEEIEIGVMVADERKEIGFMPVKEEELEIEAMEAEEEGKEDEIMAFEEGKDVGAMSDAKTWNFRPRNPIRRSLNLNGKNFGFGRFRATPKCPIPKKPVVENKKESLKKQDLNKHCLVAALTKEEIKEDWRQWAQLGIRPPKKHFKRPKCVQKQLDNIYPGAYINSVPITSDLYRVSKKDVGLM